MTKLSFIALSALLLVPIGMSTSSYAESTDLETCYVNEGGYEYCEGVEEESNLVYTVRDDGTLSIKRANAPILPTDTLIIPETIKGVPVTRIENGAFFGKEFDTLITPNTLKEIGYSAFSGVTANNIIINGNLDTIYNGAFSYAQINEKLEFTGTVETLEGFAFDRIDIKSDFDLKLDVINVSDHSFRGLIMEGDLLLSSVDNIGNFAFEKSQFKRLIIEGEDTIRVGEFFSSGLVIHQEMLVNSNISFESRDGNPEGRFAFYEANINELTINGNINIIPEFGFTYYKGNNITINGDVVEGISRFAFSEALLENLTINGDVLVISRFGFNQYKGNSININSTLPAKLGENVFSNSIIDNLTISGQVSDISDMSFYDTQINKMDIMRNVPVSIGHLAFYGFTGSEVDLVIPEGSTTKEFSDDAYYKNPAVLFFTEAKFNTLDVSRLDMPYSQNLAFSELSLKEQRLILPTSLKTLKEAIAKGNEDGDTTRMWSHITLPPALEVIEDYSLQSNNLSCITIPSTVHTIEEKAFEDNLLPLVIYGTVGTEAETFANAYGYEFIEDTIFTNLCDPSEWGVTVNYVNEAGTIVHTEAVDKPAKGILTVTANSIPAGYKLAENELASINIDINETNHSPTITFKLKSIVPSAPPDVKPIVPNVIDNGRLVVHYVDERGIAIKELKVIDIESEGTITELAPSVSNYTLISSYYETINVTDLSASYSIFFRYKLNEAINIDNGTYTVPTIKDEEPDEPKIDEPNLDEPKLEKQKLQRALRDEGNGKFTTVPHYPLEDNSLKINTRYPSGVIIVDRVELPFTDVSKSLFSYDELTDLYNYLIVKGKTSTEYKPNQDIIRGEFATMIYRAIELRPVATEHTFKDVKIYKEEIESLYRAGIITGYGNGEFGESDTLTRQQAFTMIERMLKYLGEETTYEQATRFSDASLIHEYAFDSLQYLASKDIINNDDGIAVNPLSNLTRAEMAKILMRSLRVSELY